MITLVDLFLDLEIPRIVSNKFFSADYESSRKNCLARLKIDIFTKNLYLVISKIFEYGFIHTFFERELKIPI